MKKFLLLYLLASSPTFAATMYFSEEIVPLEINNKKIESSFFSRVDKIEVEPGSHKLKIQYKDLYDTGFDDHETIESQPFWVVVDIENNDEEYLVSIPRPDDLESAKLFIKQPYAEFNRLNSKTKLRLEPVATTLMVVQTPANKMKASAHAVTESRSDTSNLTQTKQAIENNPTSSTNPNALSMLEFWWSQASEQERKVFLKDKKGD